MVLQSVFYFLQFFLLVSVRAIPNNLLYDYKGTGKRLPLEDEVSSPEINLKVPIVFYGQRYTSIFVNANGLLSFLTEIPEFFNTEFPLDYPVISPFYSNVDISGTGTIWYYETDDPNILERAAKNIHDSFTDSADYQPTSVFIATWSSVGYHQKGTDKVNTYQVVISSDGEESYAEFLYPEGGIQWIQGSGDQSGLPDARAQAGFVSEGKRYYLLPGSGTNRVKNLEKLSNINVPGVWLFRIGTIEENVNVIEPDVFKDVSGSSQKTCEKGAFSCHAFAKCIDYSEGYCCKCKDGYYGNGKFCVKNDAPLRVNGKVTGKINNEVLTNLDLQSYIVMVDGRIYTALSKIPSTIGYDFQSLQLLGGIIGWIFAKPSRDSLNGYQLTGGLFNYTATISFPEQNKKVQIHIKFLGLDLFDQLRLQARIDGEIPNIPREYKVLMPAYQESLTLTAPGAVQSVSERELKYITTDKEEVRIPFSVDQSIVFDYCPYNEPLSRATWKLKVAKNFISYESREEIVRFGLTGKISSLEETDPCDEGRKTCTPDSSCIVENDSFRCVCNPGYQFNYVDNQVVCTDINECEAGLHDCDPHAECINHKGTFQCRCTGVYEGNGRVCELKNSCYSISCPENSECKENPYPSCECSEGFVRNENQTCVAEQTESCYYANNCSPYGVCSAYPGTNQYYCSCITGYEGDGYECRPVSRTTISTVTESTNEEPVTPQCLLEYCWCPAGYHQQGEYCVTDEEITTEPYVTEAETEEQQTDTVTCRNSNECHINAQCVYVQTIRNFQCICNVGFEGDGYDCKPADVSCSEADICDVHALCKYDETLGRSVCVCDLGYEGDGRTCRRSAACRSDRDCPANEQCKYSYETQSYDCICKDGLERDSQHICNRLEDLCGAATCVENAECLYDPVSLTYYCNCKIGFIGDGINECKTRPLGCDVTNDCDRNAGCVYSEEYGYYQCKCGDGYYGDGKKCFLGKNCHNDPSICDRRAVCVTNAERQFVCQCQKGFIGDGKFCKENPSHEGNFLLLNQGVATLKIPFDASKKNPGRPIHIDRQIAVGLDVDCFDGRVYWSDIDGRSILSALYNGSSVEKLITNDIISPEGISVDWVSRNIYWTDSTKDTIEVANIDSKLRRVLFNTSLVNPRGIAVHPEYGKIFWSDWDRRGPKIEWANADGTDRQIFLQGENVKLPNSLTIDFKSRQLCYADAGTKNIECVDIDTRNRQIVAVNCTYPFGIAVTDKTIYWSDWISKKIERVDKYTLKRLPSLDVPLGGSGNKLYGLVAVPESCPPLTNVCEYARNYCPTGHFCTPDGRGSRRCLCGSNLDSSSVPGVQC